MRRILLPALILCLLAPSAFAAANLVRNGDFGEGLKYWHIHLTDFMPETIRDGDARRYRYLCACGNDLGEYKPWIGLTCPKCRGFLSGEECGKWYVENHTRVSLDDGPSGKCIRFDLPTNVGNNQGVRVFSHLIKAKPGWGYKLTFYAKAAKAHPRVFVETYAETTTEGSWNWDPNFNPYDLKRPLKRSFRAHVNCGAPTNRGSDDRTPDTTDHTAGNQTVRRGGDYSEGTDEPIRVTSGNWAKYYKEVVAPARYKFEYMSVKLYAYMPGIVWFDNVALVPMTAGELSKFKAEHNARVKDKRFKY